MKLNKNLIHHRFVELFRSTLDEAEQAIKSGSARNLNKPSSSSSQRFGTYGSSSSGTYGSSAAAYTESAYVGESTCVRMDGIPYECTETDINRWFAEVGVAPTRIHRRTNGGEAFVEFASSMDADKAVTRNKAMLGRRYIDVYRIQYNEMARIVGLPTYQPPVAAPYMAPPATAYGAPMPPLYTDVRDLQQYGYGDGAAYGAIASSRGSGRDAYYRGNTGMTDQKQFYGWG